MFEDATSNINAFCNECEDRACYSAVQSFGCMSESVRNGAHTFS
jgi:hypothetical protein